jgi:hypothetical protein
VVCEEIAENKGDAEDADRYLKRRDSLSKSCHNCRLPCRPLSPSAVGTPKCFPLLSTGGQAKWREPNRRSFSDETS